MKPIQYLGCIIILFSPYSHGSIHSDAKAGSAEFLISACQEYVELYNKKDDPRLGAFFSTSKEESFRAGYCLGAIFNTNDGCSFINSTFKIAQAIATVGRIQGYSESDVIEKATCY
ncbi:hypothetical protein L4C37_04575 [Vibrio kagoshimensis]|uniref:hypothetical protein n=1 Tax=Vibrio kagoshimensis TaxID=2910244 RepID=UPI003D1B8959